MLAKKANIFTYIVTERKQKRMAPTTISRQARALSLVGPSNPLIDEGLGAGNTAALVIDRTHNASQALVGEIKPDQVLTVSTSHKPGVMVLGQLSISAQRTNRRGQRFSTFVTTLDTADLTEVNNPANLHALRQVIAAMRVQGNEANILAFSPSQPAFHFAGYENDRGMRLTRIELPAEFIQTTDKGEIRTHSFVVSVYDQAGAFLGNVYVLGREIYWDNACDFTASIRYAIKTGAPSFTRLTVPQVNSFWAGKNGRKNRKLAKATKLALAPATKILRFDSIIRQASKAYWTKGQLRFLATDVNGVTHMINLTGYATTGYATGNGRVQEIRTFTAPKGIGDPIGRVDVGINASTLMHGYYRYIDGCAEVRMLPSNPVLKATTANGPWPNTPTRDY
jgi:hypothetical protein